MRLAEVRWTDVGEVNTEEGHKLFCSGENYKSQNGVDFLVNKDKSQIIINYIYLNKD